MKTIAALLTVHNRREKTLSCLACLFAQEIPQGYSLHTYLTDDGCTDGTPEAVHELYPQVRVVKGDGNLYWNHGMIAAWNAACADFDHDYYLWLNDDTDLAPGAIVRLLQCSETLGNNSCIVGTTHTHGCSTDLTYGGSVGKKFARRATKAAFCHTSAASANVSQADTTDMPSVISDESATAIDSPATSANAVSTDMHAFTFVSATRHTPTAFADVSSPCVPGDAARASGHVSVDSVNVSQPPTAGDSLGADAAPSATENVPKICTAGDVTKTSAVHTVPATLSDVPRPATSSDSSRASGDSLRAAGDENVAPAVEANLYPDAITGAARSVASTSADGKATSRSVRSRFRPSQKMGILTPSDSVPLPCETFNGNIVLVPRSVYHILGTLDGRYHHAVGDTDYGLRALEAGLMNYVAPGLYGECDRLEHLTGWADPSLPLRSRWKNYRSPLGNNTSELFHFRRRHYGLPVAVKCYLTNITHLLFPGLWT